VRHLLDGNVLLALAIRSHEFHEAAHRWFAEGRQFATCPSTQGTLLRLHPRLSGEPQLTVAWRSLETFVTHPQHAFWADEVSYFDVSHRGLQGGAQVTDAYLAALARHRHGKVATFDKAFSLLHPDVVVKIGAI
jgi:toxin-antitoxin system PIN domain toxin